MLKIVSFDVWDTLLSIKSFFRSVSRELAEITGENSVIIENKLIDGYKEVRAIRRTGGFKDSNIVSMALEAVSQFLKMDSETIENAILNAVEKASSEQHVIDGAKETVRLVREYNLKIIIIGNVVFWPGNYNRILLEKAKLSDFIDKQFYADELQVSKPKTEIFAKAISEFNIKPHEALHVGDSVFEDFAGAILAHMGAVLIDKNVKGVIKLSGWNAYIIPNIKLLKGIVEKLISNA